MLPVRSYLSLFIYLGFYVAFNTVQVISRQVVGRADEPHVDSTIRQLHSMLFVMLGPLHFLLLQLRKYIISYTKTLLLPLLHYFYNPLHLPLGLEKILCINIYLLLNLLICGLLRLHLCTCKSAPILRPP